MYNGIIDEVILHVNNLIQIRFKHHCITLQSRKQAKGSPTSMKSFSFFFVGGGDTEGRQVRM